MNLFLRSDFKFKIFYTFFLRHQLQYYNRRRGGDKQRALPSVPKVTIQVIKPKEDDSTDTKGDKVNDNGSVTTTLRLFCFYNFIYYIVINCVEVEKERNDDLVSRISTNNAIITNDNSSSSFNQLPLFPHDISNKGS